MSDEAGVTQSAERAPLLKRFTDALDCCGTCAGGLLAQHVREAQAAALREAADALEGQLGVVGAPHNLYQFRVWLRSRADHAERHIPPAGEAS